jgi:DNA-binding NarL/FixJ family response regulator
MLRVGLVVDRAIYGHLLGRALVAYDGLDVVAIVDAPLDMPADLAGVDVVVIDVASPSSTLAGYVAQLRARWPEIAVVLCSASSDRPTMLAAQAARVAALVDRSADLDTLVDRIHETEGALTVVSAAAIEQARHQLRTSTARSPVAAYPRLTEREREVLEQLSRGNTTAGIAGNLKISVNTCRGYMKTLMAKLGARSRVELMAFVAEHGLPTDRS